MLLENFSVKGQGQKSRVSGLASIVTAIKFSKVSAGAEPPL